MLAALGGSLCALLGAAAAHTPPAQLWQSGKERPEIVGVYLSMGYWNEAEVDATFAELESLGVNLVIDYALTPPEDESFNAVFQHYLDTAQAHGVGIAFSLFPLLNGMTIREPGEHMQDVLDLVRELRGQRAITAWYVHDEVLPSISGDGGTKHYNISLEQMRSLYLKLNYIDPSRPQLCVWNYLPQQEQFCAVYDEEHLPAGRPAWMLREEAYERALVRMVQTTCDWVLIDCYPVGAPWRDASSPAPEVEVAAIVARICGMKREQQPLLFVFQAFSWEQYDKQRAPGAPFPTTQQLTAMLSAAYGAGATGVVGYSWFDLAEEIPERDVPGKAQALDNLRGVLRSIADCGWP